MKFNDMKYVRPDLDVAKTELEEQLALIGTGQALDVEIKAIKQFYKINEKLDTQGTLCSIRNSIDTTDAFYEKEQEFFDENGPILQKYYNDFNTKILGSSNRAGLEKELDTLMFKQAEVAKKTFSEEVIPDLQKENKLTTEYSKLKASAKIEFAGKVWNLSQMTPFTKDKNRETRKEAQLAVSKFYSDNEAEFDRIFDELVTVRNTIATKLGYDNFIQLGYDRLGRTDYTDKEVKSYRDQIYETLVPITTKLQERKANRLNIDEMKYYDLPLQFLSGNPTPKGDRAWQVEKALKMYTALSPETKEFFEIMVNNDLMDLDAKPGKDSGGYCTFISDYKTPFIFANFNGTSGDVDVLTHECGHAFQVYQSRDLLPPYIWPTYEACEIHSMSMEFLAWPYIHEFFIEDTDKYKFSHLAEALEFLPYGVLVDEFQHLIYGNPTMTPTERKAAWRNTEKKYLPYKDYEGDDFLEAGNFWFKQGHIFGTPFYYIDYTLAQVVAFQYWVKNQEDPKAAFENYLALCKLGGSKSFTGLLDAAGLQNPFVQGSVKEVLIPINEYLANIDDSKF